MNQRKKHAPEFKAKVALAALQPFASSSLPPSKAALSAKMGSSLFDVELKKI